MHAEAISARNVLGREYPVDSRMTLDELRKIAKGEGRPIQRAPHNPQNERVFGPLVRSVNVLSKDFALPVETQNPLSQRAVLCGRSRTTINPVRVEHGTHNFSIARTSAKYAA